MKKIIIILLILLLTSGHSSKMSQGVAEKSRENAIKSAITNPKRLLKAKSRDEDRKPFEILKFSMVNSGDFVLEITPGEGYYTALLSRVVGEFGLVYAVDPYRVFEFLPRVRDFFHDFQSQDTRKNVHYSIQNLDEITVPTQVDQIWMVLYYHDTIWTGENRSNMNENLFNSLKPGGYFLVIDHHAREEFENSDARLLHRIDPQIVLDEITAAGFVLDEKSDVLSNSKDAKNISVFDDKLRGKTDRFVWRFKKPK